MPKSARTSQVSVEIMQTLNLNVQELEDLEAPGFRKWAAGVGQGVDLELIAMGSGVAATYKIS